MGLKYEISPENAPRFAADIAEVAEQNTGVPLDYSVESLEIVDEIIGGFHEQGVELERVEATIFGFGCYVGEVFVKNVNASWRMCTEDEFENMFGVPMILEMGEENLVNPIGKVIKRLENGEEDNLPYFYHVFTSPDAQ
ncbi:MAG: hypothetical protein HUJ26_23660 [Planctomycetaceae bacterium]|nr:hypothetical protein [Planctomycetaceae bacterium]